ncbi:transposase [Clostridium liquoris]|uniref:transposase n=1 Tax=Clostridium liquoris TaxID=1289519 RepID=UPI003BFA7692
MLKRFIHLRLIIAYDEEFKSSAVKMITEKGGNISEVSRSLDVSEPALRDG